MLLTPAGPDAVTGVVAVTSAVTSTVTDAIMGAFMGAVAVGPYAGHVAVGNE